MIEERLQKILMKHTIAVLFGGGLHIDNVRLLINDLVSEIRAAVEEAKNSEWDHGYSAGKSQGKSEAYEDAAKIADSFEQSARSTRLDSAAEACRGLARDIRARAEAVAG